MRSVGSLRRTTLLSPRIRCPWPNRRLVEVATEAMGARVPRRAIASTRHERPRRHQRRPLRNRQAPFVHNGRLPRRRRLQVASGHRCNPSRAHPRPGRHRGRLATTLLLQTAQVPPVTKMDSRHLNTSLLTSPNTMPRRLRGFLLPRRSLSMLHRSQARVIMHRRSPPRTVSRLLRLL